MAVNLLSYTGNAGLGIGSNPDIPVGNNNDLSVINNTMRDIMIMDNQRNMNLFRQKIQDRDTTNELIAKGQVPPGEILPQYRPVYEKAQQKVKDTFLKYGGNVINNPKAYQEYASAVRDLQDVAQHARANTVEVQRLQQEAAKELLPRRKEDIMKHAGKQLQQDFWNPITPYQQLHDFNIDDILSGVNPVTRTVQGQSPFETYDESYVDYSDILKNKRNQYINDMNVADSIDQFVDKLERYDPQQLGQTLDAVNKQLSRYNQERRLTPGMAGYVTPIQAVPAQGRLLIKEPKTDLAAKWALAQQQKFSTLTPKFNKDLAKFALDKERLSLQARKLNLDAAKAGAYIRNLDAKTKKFVSDQQALGTDVSKTYEDFVNGIQLMQTKEKASGKVVENLNVSYVDRLPQGYQFIAGPVMAVDKKGKPTGKITVEKLEPFISTDKSKRPYYITRYLNGQTGEDLSPDSKFVNDKYNEWRASGYPGTKEDMLKKLLKNGALEMVLQGKNGAANYTSMSQSAKALNALGTTKGEENIMNPPASEPFEPDNEPE